MAILVLSVSKIAATYAVRHAEDVRSLIGSSSRSSLSLGGRLSTTRTPCSRVLRVRRTLLVVGASGLAYFSFGWVPHVASVSAWKFRKSKDVALYSNYAFRRLNTRVSVFSFYEAATDAIFPPLDLVEFSLEFGCGSQLKLRDDFICVEIDAHDGDPEVKFAGLATRSILLPRERISDTDFKAPERPGEAPVSARR
jgi:hypothetical protein